MYTDSSPHPDLPQIKQTLSVILDPAGVAEFRVLNTRKGTVSGYFNDHNKLANVAYDWSGKASAVYVTMNPVNPKLLARAVNHTITWVKQTTGDTDILQRRWFLVDIDAKRPAGISSTDAEHKAALQRTEEVRQFFLSTGIPDESIVLADSGNGGHLLIRIELPNDAESSGLIQQCLLALDLRFSDDAVLVDLSTHNAARLCKLHGTLAAKGDSTPERPHRLARLLRIPTKTTPVPRELLQGLAAMVPTLKRQVPTSQKYDNFDVTTWVANHNLKVLRSGPWNGGTKWILATCPWNPEHCRGEAYIVQLSNGGIAAGCHHNSCAGKTWNDLRVAVEGSRKVTAGRGLSSTPKKPSQSKKGPIPRLAESICFDNHFAQDDGGKLYRYQDGVYKTRGSAFIEMRVKQLLNEWSLTKDWSSHLAKEVVEYVLVDSPRLFERPPSDILNVLNGLLNVGTGELRPHSPKFVSPIQLPVTYDPAATCPAWDKFIAEVFPADSKQIAYEIPGDLMNTDRSIQKAILLVGQGGEGKSTFLEGVRAFVGKSNTTSISLQKLEADRFAASRLVGKLANICPDLPSQHLVGTSVFKAITGGDAISAEYKFLHSFDLVPYARLVFSANNLPRSNDSSAAFFDRWVVVPFGRRFRGTDQEIPRSVLDAQLADSHELSGLLNKALTALRGLRQRNEFSESSSMTVARAEFRATTDPFAIWLDEATIDHSDAMVTKRELINAYNSHAESRGYPRMTDTGFGLALKRMRPNLQDAQKTIGGKPIWVWLGIGLRTSEVDAYRFQDSRSPRGSRGLPLLNNSSVRENVDNSVCEHNQPIKQSRENLVNPVNPVNEKWEQL